MASGFKGSDVSLERIELIGNTEVAVCHAKVQFIDPTGVVHAVTAHSLSITRADDPELYDAAKAFHDVLRARIASLHFTDPGTTSGVEKELVVHGIREALRGGADTADDVGEQG